MALLFFEQDVIYYLREKFCCMTGDILLTNKQLMTKYVIRVEFHRKKMEGRITYFLNLHTGMSDSFTPPGKEQIVTFYNAAYSSWDDANNALEELAIRCSMSADNYINWSSYTDKEKNRLRLLALNNKFMSFSVVTLFDALEEWKIRYNYYS